MELQSTMNLNKQFAILFFLLDFYSTLTGYDCDLGNEMKGEEYLLSLVNIYIKCNKSLFAPFSLWITK